MNINKRFYLAAFTVLILLSAYPLINGIRMAYLNFTNGAIEPEQYAKYVVPYAAICISLLSYTALQPILIKLKRFTFPAGLITTYGIFFAVERFFETMKIHVTGMTLINTSTLTPDAAGSATTADIWQAALCIASPDMRGQSLTYASQDRFLYVLEDNTYKIHYYLISLILITMVCGLIYGTAKMFRNNDLTLMNAIFLRGASTMVLVALCIFANTTAFFRQAAPIQTPIASILTALFFIALGAATAIYTGSYLLKKGVLLGIGVPILLSLCVTVSMYVGEMVMMSNNLYRFGTGWFFNGLPGIVLAPVDILIVLLSGALTWLILGIVRKNENHPSKRIMIAIIVLCTATAVTGPIIALTASGSIEDDLSGCYVFDKEIYMNPFSSFRAFGNLPYVYGFNENMFIIADTNTGDIQSYTIQYCKTPVNTDEFSSKIDDLLSGWLPDLSMYKERYLIAAVSDGNNSKFGVYRMDGEIWIAELRGIEIWSIYRLKKTETTKLDDLERTIELYEKNLLSSPLSESQMTLKDIYTLARKGGELTLYDFEPFSYQLSGSDFMVRRYDAAGANTVFVHTKEGLLESALLMSHRTLNPSDVIDLREGFEAVTKYMNPLKSFNNITIDDSHGGENGGEYARELIYEYDYDCCQYYLNRKHTDDIYVIFESGERMQLKQALMERRITVEDVAAHGLYNISMVPIDNPFGLLSRGTL